MSTSIKKSVNNKGKKIATCKKDSTDNLDFVISTQQQPFLSYHKRKNIELFQEMKSPNGLALLETQNYIPLYSKLFQLKPTNYQHVNLNHEWYLFSVKDKINENIFDCQLKNMNEFVPDKKNKVFFKFIPLIDPFEYMTGKYKSEDMITSFNTLPKIEENMQPIIENKIQKRMKNPNNAAYVDGFFVYLSNMLLSNFYFPHGLEYYGGFLGFKQNFHLNVIDDIEYLNENPNFHKWKNKLFQIEDYTDILRMLSHENDTQQSLFHKPRLIIKNETACSQLTVDSLPKDDLFEDCFFSSEQENEPSFQNLNESSLENIREQYKASSSKTKHENDDDDDDDHSCSSRTSITTIIHEKTENSQNTEDIKDTKNIEDIDDEDIEDIEDIEDDEDIENDEDIEDEETEITETELDTLYAIMPSFPIMTIAMENCVETLDKLIIEKDLTDDEWFSTLFQIIMILLTYQETFSFTHNDLHSNNIMYVKTNLTHLYYCYRGIYYKIPTYGRIYKIIDFGRSIYKWQTQMFCSDHYEKNGDASNLYNIQPFFNPNKEKLDPNPSFDLCRFACSIIDYFLEDDEDYSLLNGLNNIEKITEDPVKKLIIEWCLDDKGNNVCFKSNGKERYPDFKLYKMIARKCHKHTPQNQLLRPEFNSYIIDNPRGGDGKKKNRKSIGSNIIDIDAILLKIRR
jgi:hypothetical protein